MTNGFCPCTVMHPGVLPPLLTDPLNPITMRAQAEVSGGALVIWSPVGRGEPRKLGTEPLGGVRVTVRERSGTEQRKTVLLSSLWRLAPWVVLGMVWALWWKQYPPIYGLYIGLAGGLHFALYGGLGRKQDVYRFTFTPERPKRVWWLEVSPEQQGQLRETLREAGASVAEA
ncbi:MAG: hypothetical protein BWY10_02436 [Chloroflexi bacterium ADurb.Bin180]|nr:MAG: hypothetical protein BWY10_02436 [Chloroflexi bacterium ADurb.Bin180]